jgi:hypothetical protein
MVLKRRLFLLLPRYLYFRPLLLLPSPPVTATKRVLLVLFALLVMDFQIFAALSTEISINHTARTRVVPLERRT